MSFTEDLTAEALRNGSMTPVEFEEFWREYDRLMSLIIDAQDAVAVPRVFVPARD